MSVNNGGNKLRLADMFPVIVYMTIGFGVAAFGAEVVNAAGGLPQPIDNTLPADAFKYLFGVLTGILDPSIGKRGGNGKEQ